MDSASGIKVLHSFYSSERDVYSRMVFKLNIDPLMAMKIIAFWLWLQETADTDIIRRVKTFTDPGLMAVSLLGENYLKGASECIRNGTSNTLNERAISGVNHYLHKVCYKAFDDIKDKAELEKAKKRLEALTIEDLLPEIQESSSRRAYLSNNGFGRTAHMQSHHDLLREITEPSVSRSYSSNTRYGRSANLQIHNDLESRSYSSSNGIGSSPNLLQIHNDFESSAMRSYLGRSASMQTQDVIDNLPDDLLTDLLEPSSAGAYTSNTRNGTTSSAQDYFNQMADLYTTQAYSSYGSNTNINHRGLEQTNTLPRNELSPTAQAYFPSSHTTNNLTRSFSAPTNYTKNIPTNQNASLLPYLTQQSSYSAPNTPLNPSTLPLSTPQSILGARGKNVILNTLPNPLVVGPPSQQDIYPDERTLFVTFSNGWPLNTEEIYYFFSLEYGNDLERIYIEEPAERRDPQYSHVTFRHIETIFQVLGDEPKKKFLTNGKHLWARRFIPKKKKFTNNINVNNNIDSVDGADAGVVASYNDNYY